MVTIIPAILATNEEEFLRQLENIKSSPALAEGWVHIDIMDGQLVETRSIDPETLNQFEIPLKKEAHLMVSRPSKMVEELVKQKFDRIILHLESSEELFEVIQKVKSYGVEVGLAVNPETGFQLLKQFIKFIDVIQVMGVHPGKQGQQFEDSTYDKVKEAAAFFHTVSVDGGVSAETAVKLIGSGAHRLVAGSYLQKGDIDENLEKIWETLQK